MVKTKSKKLDREFFFLEGNFFYQTLCNIMKTEFYYSGMLEATTNKTRRKQIKQLLNALVDAEIAVIREIMQTGIDIRPILPWKYRE